MTPITVSSAGNATSATFAHDLMALPSHTYQHLDHNNLNLVPDLPHTDESNVRYKNTWHYGRAMLGYVLTRLDDWKALPMDGAENAFGLTWRDTKRRHGMDHAQYLRTVRVSLLGKTVPRKSSAGRMASSL